MRIRFQLGLSTSKNPDMAFLSGRIWIPNGSRVSFPTTPLWASMVSLRGPAILFDLDPLWSGSGFGFTADPDPAIHFKGSGSGIFIRLDLRILKAPGWAELHSNADPASQNYADLCGMRIRVNILFLQIHTQKVMERRKGCWSRTDLFKQFFYFYLF